MAEQPDLAMAAVGTAPGSGEEPTGPTVSRSGASGKLCMPPERFVALHDAVALELEDLEYPWNLKSIDEKIQDYTTISESINSSLSARVMQNYNEFVQGMQQVQAVETELTLIGVLVKNGRRKLQERDATLVRGSMQVTKQHRKSERLSKLLSTMSEFQGVVRMDTQLQHCLDKENYCEAIRQHAALRDALVSDRFKQFPGLGGLREGLDLHLAAVRQKLSDGLKVAAVSADFDANRYEEILRAYSMMSPDQTFSVGKELLRHVSECIVAVSRQCMLAFSSAPSHESHSAWHRKAQLCELGRSMDPTHFVAVTAQLYEHLCDFLYRHHFLCVWHQDWEINATAAGLDVHGNQGFREVLRDVLAELAASRRSVWDRIQQQVAMVLMTLDFQYPGLSEDNFLQILHMTQLLIEEGDSFMADCQPARGSTSYAGRQFSTPIRNTLKSKAHEYFQSLHHHAWVHLKIAYIEQDSWQRLPVPRSYALIRADRLKPALPPRPQAEKPLGADGSTAPKAKTFESNPFRNYKPLALQKAEEPTRQDAGGLSAESAADGEELDDHALLRHWIDDNDSLPHTQIGSSMLSNSNRGPVVSTSTAELARVLERYFRMMGAIPQLALDIFQSAIQLIEFYVQCVLCLFVQDKQLRALLEDMDAPLPPGDGRLQSRHDAFLLQRLCPDLRRAAIRTRDFVASLSLPDGCAEALNMKPPVTGAVLLHVTPFPKLTSPSSLCGLSERCVGVESAGSLLGDLRGVQEKLLQLLPQTEAQEVADRFFAHQELVAAQLRTFVCVCAARDVLEEPELGKVSLDHFSNTVQALRWEAKDFSQGSPAAQYLQQLRSQIDELARRIPSAGGGSIPYATQRTVWRWMEVRIMHECAEVVAKCGRKKSQEAIQCLADDFQFIRNAVQEIQSFNTPEGPEEVPLLPPEHPLGDTVQWSYLTKYIEAHGYTATDGLNWCRRHPQYPLRLHKSLIDYLHGNNKKTVLQQCQVEFETFLANHMAETN